MTVATPGSWPPLAERDLRAGLIGGLLEETHRLEVKREIGAPTRSTNKELARDLAQFGIDSGVLLIGVAEEDDSSLSLHPITLAGLAERVEQIARTAIDPPLTVSCRPIASQLDPSRGYLWVDVPASMTAPHMVDGTYYGRGDKTKIRLSDSEVRRHHAAQDAASARIDDALDDYIARDPVKPLALATQAHLFVILTPVAARPELLLPSIDGDDAQEAIRRIIHDGGDISPLTAHVHPSLTAASSYSRRGDGVAMTSIELSNGRTLNPRADNGEDSIEVELTENGTVRLMHTRLSDTVNYGRDVALFETFLPALTRQAIGIASEVARATGYGGGWLCGIAAIGLGGLKAHLNGSITEGEHRVPADVTGYRQTATASTHELGNESWAVANRLCGRYVRMLGLQEWEPIGALLNAPERPAD